MMKEKILAIEYLRGIAAVAVLLAHWADEHHNMYGEQAAHLPKIIGSWGVDLFFIVSGIVSVFITRYAAASLASVRLFVLRRIARIVPGYWFSIAVMTVIIAWRDVTPEQIAQLGGWLAALKMMMLGSMSSLFFYKYHFFPINPVGWTLNIEMFFYGVFAMGLLLSNPRYRPWLVALLIAVMVVWNQYAQPAGYLGFMTRPLMLEFLIGVLLGFVVSIWHETGRPAVAWARVLFWVGLALLIYICCFVPQKQILPNRWLLWGGPSALIVIGAILGFRESFFNRWRWPAVLGAWSYSIYLLHMPTFYLLNVVGIKLGLSTAEAMQLLTVAGIPLTLLFAKLCYQYIELPSGKYLRRAWRL